MAFLFFAFISNISIFVQPDTFSLTVLFARSKKKPTAAQIPSGNQRERASRTLAHRPQKADPVNKVNYSATIFFVPIEWRRTAVSQTAGGVVFTKEEEKGSVLHRQTLAFKLTVRFVNG